MGTTTITLNQSQYTPERAVDVVFTPVQEPQTAPSGVGGDAGVLNGTYTYMCTFVTTDGETEGRIQSADVVVTNKKINLSNIPVSSDSRVIARNIYRKPAASAADVEPLNFLVQIADNVTTTYVDNIADASLGALVNRVNTTGGQLYSNSNLLMSSDTTNLSIGWDSGYLGTAYACTAVGIHTMPANYGVRNSAFGMYALFSNTSGGRNTAVGAHALNYNLTGSDSVAVGYTALMNSTVAELTAVGSRCLTTNSTGTKNTGVGYMVLNATDTGSFNTAVGHSALKLNTGGGYNTAVGYNTLIAVTTNNYNTAVGYEALKNVAAGTNNQNTAIGYAAGTTIVAGGAATAINNCTFIGAGTKPLNNYDNNSIVIGKDAQGQGSNSVVLGSSSVTKTFLQCYICELSKEVDAANTLTAKTIAKGNTYFTGTAGASMAITLPAAAATIDGTKVIIMSTVERVTTTWISSGATGGFIGAPSTLAANTPYTLQYDHASLAWYISA